MVGALAPHRPLVIYDQRGFGQSSSGDDPYSHAADLAALLDALEIARADVCGMSLGGATAIDFALDHPGRVRRLILISPLMTGWAWSQDWIDRWKVIGRAARSGDPAQARRLWWEHPLFDTLRSTPAGDVMHRSIEAFHGRQWIADPQLPTPVPAADRIATLASPTLLLTARHDTPDFREIGHAIATRAPDVAHIDHADAGHMLNLEIPETVAAEIDRFLDL